MVVVASLSSLTFISFVTYLTYINLINEDTIMKNLLNQIKALLLINETINESISPENSQGKACNYPDNYYGDQVCR
mgnify:CR=1 FL=1